MGFFDGYDIATSGMSAQRSRINVVSANIANAQTTHSAEGGPYKRQNVVFEEVLLGEKNKNNIPKSDFEKNINDSLDKQRVGVGIQRIVDARDEPILKYDPGHPDASETGYVAYPNINPVIEMTDLMEAMRAYEANLTSFQTRKTMDTKTIDLLKA
jgi:flagellar basal-body rod protein FlgC